MRLILPLSVLLLVACGPTSSEVAAPASPAGLSPAAPAPTEATQPAADAAAMPMSPAQPGLLTEAQFAALHQLTGEAAPPAKGQRVDLAGSSAYLSLPEGATGPVPGVLVIHEWWGLNDHIQHWADRLAAAGYAALAVDLYGGTVATTPEAAMAAMKSVDEARAQEILEAGLAFLRDDPRVKAPKTGVIGWCFGGGWSLRTAMTQPGLDAAVVYYGRIPEDLSGLAAMEAPVFGVFGERDQGIPVATVRAFEAAAKQAGKSVTVQLYDADHAFANPSSARYAAGPADDAWTRAKAFLAAHLGG